MARKTEEAAKDFQVAARTLRVNVARISGNNVDTTALSINQKNMADDIAFIADGLQKVALALKDIFDVVARIEAKQGGGTTAPRGGAQPPFRNFPSTP